MTYCNTKTFYIYLVAAFRRESACLHVNSSVLPCLPVLVPVKDSATAVLRCLGGRVESTGRVLVLLLLMLLLIVRGILVREVCLRAS